MKIRLRYRILLACALLLIILLWELIPAGGKRLKVAAVFPTSIDEPWVSCIHQALLKAEKVMNIHYEYRDEIPPEDLEQVLNDYVRRGYDAIFGDAYGNEELVRNVAGSHPQVRFVFGSGLGPASPNLAVFDSWIQEPAYMCGMIAGKLTETNVVGVVGGYPVAEVNRTINAFRMGVKEANQEAKVKVTFVDSWFDPPKAKDAALEQIDAGVDVIYAERLGVIEAAEERGILAFGNLLDQNGLAPDTVVTGPIWDLWPTVNHALAAIREATFKPIDYREWSMMGKGGAYLAPLHKFRETLPKQVLDMVQQRAKQILSQEFEVTVDESVPSSE